MAAEARALAAGNPASFLHVSRPEIDLPDGTDEHADVVYATGAENLREVALFPMNQQAVDLLMGAPSEVTTKQLRELHIRLNLPDK